MCLLEKIEVDKEMFDTMRCLIVALIDKHCDSKEFILTKEQRKDLVGQIKIKVGREVLDNNDERYYLY